MTSVIHFVLFVPFVFVSEQQGHEEGTKDTKEFSRTALFPVPKAAGCDMICPQLHVAGEPVVALVSGLAPVRRETRPLLMLQAYIDDSGVGGPLLVLAGYIATAPAWAEFSRDWQELLDMRPRWPYAKMSEIAQSQDAARWERAQALYRVIERHVLEAGPRLAGGTAGGHGGNLANELD